MELEYVHDKIKFIRGRGWSYKLADKPWFKGDKFAASLDEALHIALYGDETDLALESLKQAATQVAKCKALQTSLAYDVARDVWGLYWKLRDSK